MEERYIGDLRPSDIEKTKRAGIESDWVNFWENFMHAESDKVLDENQKSWHTSRLSFLKGYEIGSKQREDVILEFIKAIRGDKSFTNPEMDKLKEMIETSKIDDVSLVTDETEERK